MCGLARSKICIQTPVLGAKSITSYCANRCSGWLNPVYSDYGRGRRRRLSGSDRTTGQKLPQHDQGFDASRRRYHGLNPETFYCAHATFFMLLVKVAEYFCGGLTKAEKRH